MKKLTKKLKKKKRTRRYKCGRPPFAFAGDSCLLFLAKTGGRSARVQLLATERGYFDTVRVVDAASTLRRAHFNSSYSLPIDDRETINLGANIHLRSARRNSQPALETLIENTNDVVTLRDLRLARSKEFTGQCSQCSIG